MGYYNKWKPSKAAAQEFASKMRDVEDFVKENNIRHSISYDSFYFVLNGKTYRVSNHTVEKSNRDAFDWMGNQIRPLYHDRDAYDVYITASKTRIIEIYNDLKAGYNLDARGRRKEA